MRVNKITYAFLAGFVAANASIFPSFAEVITSKKELAGKCFDWSGYGKSRFGANGGYTFEGTDGSVQKGHWSISKDGTVSIKFTNGFARVDKFDVNGSSVVDSGPKGGSGTLCN